MLPATRFPPTSQVQHRRQERGLPQGILGRLGRDHRARCGEGEVMDPSILNLQCEGADWPRSAEFKIHQGIEEYRLQDDQSVHYHLISWDAAKRHTLVVLFSCLSCCSGGETGNLCCVFLLSRPLCCQPYDCCHCCRGPLGGRMIFGYLTLPDFERKKQMAVGEGNLVPPCLSFTSSQDHLKRAWPSFALVQSLWYLPLVATPLRVALGATGPLSIHASI